MADIGSLDVDLGRPGGTGSDPRLQDAIEAARDRDRITWLAEDGRQIAAIVPAHVAGAGGAAHASLSLLRRWTEVAHRELAEKDMLIGELRAQLGQAARRDVYVCMKRDHVAMIASLPGARAGTRIRFTDEPGELELDGDGQWVPVP